MASSPRNSEDISPRTVYPTHAPIGPNYQTPQLQTNFPTLAPLPPGPAIRYEYDINGHARMVPLGLPACGGNTYEYDAEGRLRKISMPAWRSPLQEARDAEADREVMRLFRVQQEKDRLARRAEARKIERAQRQASAVRRRALRRSRVDSVLEVVLPWRRETNTAANTNTDTRPRVPSFDGQQDMVEALDEGPSVPESDRQQRGLKRSMSQRLHDMIGSIRGSKRQRTG